MSKRRQMIAPSEIARSVLLYLGRPSSELKAACARYLASLHPTEHRREAALQTPPDERVANARAAIAARWSSRPAGTLPVDQAAIMARLRSLESVAIKAVGARRRTAIAALAAAGRIRVLEQTETSVTIAAALPNHAK